MANLLDLVDVLIGSLLQNNLYTNEKTYETIVKTRTPQSPNPVSLPNNDPRSLNFQGTNPHPHDGLTGLNPPSIIPVGNPPALHDNVGDFLNSQIPSGIVAAQTPTSKRGLFYVPPVPKDVGQQIDTSKAGEFPRGTTIDINPSLSDFNEFSKVSLSDQGISPTIPTKTLQTPSSDQYDALKKQANISTAHTVLPTSNLQTLGEMAQPPVIHDYLNKEKRSDVPLDNVQLNKSFDHSSYIKANDVSQHLTPDQYKDVVKANTSFAKGQSFDPQTRKDIYTKIDPKTESIVSNVAGTPVSNPTQNDIYNTNRKVPSTLNFKGQKDIPSTLSAYQTEGNKITDHSNDIKANDTITHSTPTQYRDLESVKVGSLSITNPTSMIPLKEGEVALGNKTTNTNTYIPSAPSGFNKPTLLDTVGKPTIPTQTLTKPTEQQASDLINQANISFVPAILPTSAQPIIQPVDRFDQFGTSAYRLGNTYDDGDTNFARSALGNEGGKYHNTAFVGPLQVFDVAAIANWFRNIGRELALFKSPQNDYRDPIGKIQRTDEAITKGLTWLASQFLLTALNPVYDVSVFGIGNAIWNPLSMPLSLVPLTRVTTPISNITVGAVAGSYKSFVQDTVANNKERLVQMRNGTWTDKSVPQRLLQLRTPIGVGFIGDTVSSEIGGGDKIDEGPGFGTVPSIISTIKGQLGEDTLVERGAQFQGAHTNIYTTERPYGQSGVRPLSELNLPTTANPQQERLDTLFTPKTFPGSGNATNFNANFRGNAYTFINNISSAISMTSLLDPDAPGAGPNVGIVDAKLDTTETEDGTTLALLGEDTLYMPFMFQDLREVDKFLYFRAFLKNDLTENFSVDWNQERFYGRVDMVPTYQGTTRTINLSFDVVAFKRSDLDVIWRKLGKLQSMVYPEYDASGFLSKGPIIRMRVGDLICGAGNKGIPGYITSLDFSYDDGIWEIDVNNKVPRKISVSLTFTVLHDGNPGIYPNGNITIETGNTQPTGDGVRTFGAGKITSPAENQTEINVSIADIRKIFDPGRGAGGGA